MSLSRLVADDDDDNALSLLLAGDAIDESLPALVRRFREDHTTSTVFEELVERASFPGISYTTNDPNPQPTDRSTAASVPEDRVAALASILEIPKPKAVDLLLLSGNKGISDCIPLIQNCVDLHFRHRIVRIETVTELLRKGMTEPLQEVDSITLNGSRSPRGLMRLLLCSACQDVGIIPRRPRNKLRSEMSDTTWDLLIQDATYTQQLWKPRESGAALEAIMVLLYDYVEVDRCDLILLMTALRGLTIGRKLVSLILAECVALWRVFDYADHETIPWQSRHPLLRNDSPDHGELLQLVDKVCASKDQALLILSFGLLLNATGQAALRSLGLKVANRANAEHDAFGTLYSLMESMVQCEPKKVSLGFDDLVPYECRSFVNRDIFDITEAENELGAASLAVASIGREILSASINSFGDLLLPTTKLPQTSNVSRLASIAAVVFRNSTRLCEQFWSDWSTDQSLPLCRLMESSYRLAHTAFDATKNGFRDRDEVLLSLTSLIQLTSSLVYDAEIVKSILGTFFPPNFIRTALNLVSSANSSEVLKSCRARIVSSLATFISIGSESDDCRKLLREMLDGVEHNDVDGPQVLASLVPLSNEVTIPSIFASLADLVEGAPPLWLLGAVKAIRFVQNDQTIWRGMIESGDAAAMIRLAVGLLKNLPDLVFSEIDEDTTEHVLNTMGLCVQVACELLSTCRLKATELESAIVIMDGISSALKHLRGIVELHVSQRVREIATAILDDLLHGLGTRLGETVVLYVVCPCMLSVMAALEHSSSDTPFSAVRPLDTMNTAASQIRGDNLREEFMTHLRKLNKLDLFGRETAAGQGSLSSDKGSCLRAALSALRLLSWWSKTIEIKGSFSTDLAGRVSADAHSLSTKVLFAGPLRLLFSPLACPLEIQSDSTLRYAWDSLQVVPLSLLPSYCRTGNHDIQLALANETLDFISTIVFECSADENAKSYLFRGLNCFGCFHEVCDDFVVLIKSIESTVRLSQEDMLAVSVASRFLRLLGSLLESEAVLCTEVVRSMSSFRELVCFMKVALSEVLDSSKSLGDQSMVARLRLAGGCAFCLRVLWGSRSFDLDSVLEEKLTFFELLLSCCLDGCNRIGSLVPEDLHGRCALVSLLSLTLEILGIELSAASSNLLPSTPICLASTNAINGDYQRVVDAARTFHTIESAEPLSRMWEIFGTQHSASLEFPPQLKRGMLLYVLGGPSCYPGSPYFTQSSGRNVQAWKSYCGAFGEEMTSIENLELLSAVVSSELSCQTAWSSFFCILQDAISCLPDTNFAMAQLDFACAYTSTLYEIASRRGNGFRESLAATKQTSKELSSLMQPSWLSFAAQGDGRRFDWWIETFESVAQLYPQTAMTFVTAAEFFELVGISLLVPVFLLDSTLPEQFVQHPTLQARFGHSLVSLCFTACEAVNMVSLPEGNDFERVDESGFRSYFLFLSFAVDFGREIPAIAAQLCEIFTKFDLMPSLLRYATKLGDSKSMSFQMESTVSFFGSFASLADPTLLEYFASNEMALLKLNRSLSLSCSKNAGKVCSSGLGFGLRTYADLLCDCLRLANTATKNGTGNLYTFRKLAVAFVQTHSQELLGVLEQCSQVVFGQQSAGTATIALTLSVVREASSALSLLGELALGDPQSEDHQDSVLSIVKGKIFALVAVFSSYLASASSAREIFYLCDEFDSSTAMMAVDFHYCHKVDYLRRLVASGPQNAKHDAIRYTAQFVLNMFQPKSEAENASRNKLVGRLGDRVGSTDKANSSVSESLEKRCRHGVSNRFIFETEKEVAKCLFHALNVLKRSFPAQNFVMFTDDELQRLDPLIFIKPGMCIAFRCDDLTNEVRCAKVHRCDGVGRLWQACLVWPTASAGESIEVPVSQFLGVQDRSARNAIFPRSSAPDSSVELQYLVDVGQSASTAHLILLLRWSRQLFDEIHGGGEVGGSDEIAFVIRFAELLTGLLSVELSIHNFVDLQPTSSTANLEEQLLDLYGEPFELAGQERSGPAEHALGGKLKPLLSSESFASARLHMRAYLDRALSCLNQEEGSRRGSMLLNENRFYSR